MATVFDYINSINNKKYIFDPEDKKNYSEYVINKAFSLSADTLFFANEVNRLNLQGKAHYDFYYHLISKRRRFNEWHKVEKIEDLTLISDYFNVSDAKAKEYLKILKEEDLIALRKVYEERDTPRSA